MAFANARTITPGTPLPVNPPAQQVVIACSAAGTVMLRLADGSTLPVYANIGTSTLYDIAVIDVVAGQTSATAVVSVLS